MRYARIGVDEAGRGPIAGPVAVAVVAIVDESIIASFFPDGVRDSKKLTQKRREYVYATIQRYAKEGRLAYASALVSAHTIDDVGITASCTAGVGGVLARAKIAYTDAVMLDGRLYAPKEYTAQVSHDKGDETYPEIALASVVAKCVRDARMRELGTTYPVYGFEGHKGYGTKAHYEALERHGLCPEHRKSFLKGFLKKRVQ